MQPYVIGDATIFNGDCLDVMKDIPDSSIDMVFTDPPYGHNNNAKGDLISRWEKALGKDGRSSTVEARPIANDGAEADEIVRQAFIQVQRILKKGSAACFCCGGGGPDPMFARWSLWLGEVLDFKQMIIWDKGPMGMGWHYRRSYEVVLVATKPGAACKWYDDSDKVENIIRHTGKIRKIIPSKDEHPTPKPVELPEHFIKLHTQPGDVVLDPFMGGCSTGRACMRTGRKFIGVEIDKRWYDYSSNLLDDYWEPSLFKVIA